MWLGNVELKNIHNSIEGVERGRGYGDKRGGSGVEGEEAGVEGAEAGIEGAGSGNRGSGIGARSLESLGGKLIFYRKFKEKGP